MNHEGMTMSSSASMPSSTGSSMSSSSMSGMSGSSMMGMQDMMMVFFTAANTPLWSQQWSPTSQGQYAGTCIFLIIFSAIFRGLVALRIKLPQVFDRTTRARHTQILVADAKGACAGPRPWRLNEALIQAFLDTILAAVGYLLMLAVMTMNVGYFLSILAGVFVGSVAFGRQTGAIVH